jgi:hypothetical protein
LVAGINAVMTKLADSLGESREVAGDFRQAWLNITHVAGEMGDVVKGSMEKLTPAIVSLDEMAKQSASEARAVTASVGSLGDLMVQLIELNKTQLDQGETTSGQLQGIADINDQMRALNESLMQVVLNNALPVVGHSVEAEVFMDAVQTIARSSESQSSVSAS